MTRQLHARLLIVLAAAVPLTACAAAPAVPGAPPNPAQDTRNADAGTKPASVVQAPAPATSAQATTPPPAARPPMPSAAEVTAPATAAGAPVPSSSARAAAPDARSGITAGTTVGDSGTGAAADAGAQDASAAAPAPVTATPARPPSTAPVTMPSGSASGSLLQTMFALLAVLAILAALAWFLKRYGPKMGGGTANLRIVGSLNLGGRERLLVVEVGEQWIVVGASPGRVNALATMPRQEGADGVPGGATLAAHGTQAASPAHSFADWLKQTIDKRK